VFLVENASVPHDPRVWKEAKVARSLGFEVSVVSPRGTSIDTEKFSVIDGIPVYRYRQVVLGSGFLSYVVEYLNALMLTAWLVFRINRQRTIDVFHVANPPDLFFLVVQWYRWRGARYIFDIHDLFVNTFESKFERKRSPFKRLISGLLGLIERTNIACADLLVVTNQSYQDYVTGLYHYAKDKIFIVRNAPPLDNRLEIEADPALKRGKSHMLVFFGNMGEDDGVDVILRALAYLRDEKQFEDFICYLIGPTEVSASPAIGELLKLHDALHLSNNVVFTGYLSWHQVHCHLNTADVGLSPDPYTRQNDLSTMIKIMEYMSHGLPIVSFNLKENRYSASNAAVYCEGYDYREFGVKILSLLCDPAVRQAMRAAGLERYRSDFNWTNSTTSLVQTYERILGMMNGVNLQKPEEIPHF